MNWAELKEDVRQNRTDWLGIGLAVVMLVVFLSFAVALAIWGPA